MGKVLRLPRPRRYPAKWSAVRRKGFFALTLEWRTADRAFCATQTISVDEWLQVSERAVYFWAIIESLRDLAISRGARF